MRPHTLLTSKLHWLAVAMAVAGCGQMPTMVSPYRIDIQQGNVVTQEMVDKLKPGMTRSQVRFALGSPLIVDPFRTDRWDYVYTYQKQGKKLENRRIVVIFQEDKLLRVEGDVLPQAASPAQPLAAQPSVPATPAPKPDAAPPEDAASARANDAPAAEKGNSGGMREKLGP